MQFCMFPSWFSHLPACCRLLRPSSILLPLPGNAWYHGSFRCLITTGLVSYDNALHCLNNSFLFSFFRSRSLTHYIPLLADNSLVPLIVFSYAAFSHPILFFLLSSLRSQNIVFTGAFWDCLMPHGLSDLKTKIAMMTTFTTGWPCPKNSVQFIDVPSRFCFN